MARPTYEHTALGGVSVAVSATVTAGNKLVAVVHGRGETTAPSVTRGSQTFDLIASNSQGTGTGRRTVAIFELDAPTTGTADITLTSTWDSYRIAYYSLLGAGAAQPSGAPSGYPFEGKLAVQADDSLVIAGSTWSSSFNELNSLSPSGTVVYATRTTVFAGGGTIPADAGTLDPEYGYSGSIGTVATLAVVFLPVATPLAPESSVELSTPVWYSTTGTISGRTIDVPTGTDAILFFLSSRSSGLFIPVSAFTDGTQHATELASSGGTNDYASVWILLNPTPGSSNWSVTGGSGSTTTGRGFGYSFVTGLDTSDPYAATVAATTWTTHTAIGHSVTISDPGPGSRVISYAFSTDTGVQFTWVPWLDQVYNAAHDTARHSVATRNAPVAAEYEMGGDFPSSPTRSRLLTIALRGVEAAPEPEPIEAAAAPVAVSAAVVPATASIGTVDAPARATAVVARVLAATVTIGAITAPAVPVQATVRSTAASASTAAISAPAPAIRTTARVLAADVVIGSIEATAPSVRVGVRAVPATAQQVAGAVDSAATRVAVRAVPGSASIGPLTAGVPALSVGARVLPATVTLGGITAGSRPVVASARAVTASAQQVTGAVGSAPVALSARVTPADASLDAVAAESAPARVLARVVAADVTIGALTVESAPVAVSVRSIPAVGAQVVGAVASVPVRVSAQVLAADVVIGAVSATAPPVRVTIAAIPAALAMGTITAPARPVRVGLAVTAATSPEAVVTSAPPVRVVARVLAADVTIGALAPFPRERRFTPLSLSHRFESLTQTHSFRATVRRHTLEVPSD